MAKAEITPGMKEHLAKIGPDGQYRYQLPRIKVTSLLPKEPFHQYLYLGIQAALNRQGSEITVTSEGKFPKDVQAALCFDKDLLREQDPQEMYGRHTKPRNHKKVGFIGTVSSVPSAADYSPALSSTMRKILAKKACHFAIVVEGETQQKSLSEGARAFIGSMEGNVGQEIFRGEPQEFFDCLAARLTLLSGAEMINARKGERTEVPTFEQWCVQPAVQEIAWASRYLGENGLLWDLDLLKDFASPGQMRAILRALKQAGLGEGNLSAMVKDLQVMAITETGVSKTHINPRKGEVVAIPAITENGTVHWIMKGLPQGHPVTLFQAPSRERLEEVLGFVASSYRIGGLRQLRRDILTRRIRVDRPPSIETNENAQFYLAGALLEAGRVTTFEDFLKYLGESFSQSQTLPVIPEGVKVAAEAAAHLHSAPKLRQSNSSVKIVNPDQERFGFRHTPSCGSREASFLILVALFQSYQEFGSPASRDEIRGALLPGHGSFFWGYNGMKHLVKTIVEKVEFEKHVPPY